VRERCRSARFSESRLAQPREFRREIGRGERIVFVAGRIDDVDLVIAGDGSSAVRATVEERLHKVSDRVRWAGPVLDASRDALLAQASALVMCSDSENFGMSVAEALAAGVAPGRPGRRG